VRLPALITWVEEQFRLAAIEMCNWCEKARLGEEGDPPDAHQHIDPMPFDYNLSVRDVRDRLVIRHNFH
jgi:hypothetical protein